eukprot:scaffold29799_cov70-Cyclotella_meneghiniana.AAC.11
MRIKVIQEMRNINSSIVGCCFIALRMIDYVVCGDTGGEEEAHPALMSSDSKRLTVHSYEVDHPKSKCTLPFFVRLRLKVYLPVWVT